MNTEKIKLIGVDLDGTLLTDDKRLFPETTEKIKELSKRGIHFVPITGRAYSGIPEDIKQIKEIQYMITSNGSEIIEAKTGKALFSFPLSNNKIGEIIDVLEKSDCMFEVFTDNLGYVEKKLYDYYVKEYSGTPIGEYIFSSIKLIPSIRALFEDKKRSADEIFILCKSNTARNELERELADITDIQLCNLGDKCFEITGKDVNKGEALAVLCDYLDIDIHDTIALGDGENDLQFLERAGIAVAMENACAQIKERADIITKSNNENGVLEILKII